MAISTSTISVIINGQAVGLQQVSEKAVRSLDSVGAAARRVNADMMEQRRVMRALNPAITANDKAMDAIVSSTIAATKARRAFNLALADDSGLGLRAGGISDAASDLDEVNVKMARFQAVAQQGVFAIDDFIAGFSTGGIAGGLRGAANNISLMAMMLGTLKTQLVAIGAIAATQLVVSLWQRQEQEKIQAMTREVENLIRAMNALTDANAQALDVQFELADVGKLQSVEDVTSRLEDQARSIAKTRLQISEEFQNIESLQGQADVAFKQTLRFNFSKEDEERLRLLNEDIETRRERILTLDRELQAQLRVNRALEKQLEINKLANPFMRGMQGAGAAGLMGEMAGALAKNSAISAARFASMDAGTAFGRLPSAETGAGAIAAINQAMIGPRNMQDAQHQILDVAKKTEVNTRRAAEHLGNMAGNKAVQVGI